MSIILGLGSNQGDRLHHLRLAIHALEQIVQIVKISPVYISDALMPDGAPTDWNQSFLNIACVCETILDPHTLLLKIKQIESQLGRDLQAPRWSPRVIDIDILAGDDWHIATPELTIPHAQLLERPFALWPLMDVAPKNVLRNDRWGSRFTGEAPFRTRQIAQRIQSPQLMGIINVTPDSFSDGGLFLTPDAAIAQAKQLIADGAEILDIGAESTAPHVTPLDANTEWQRLEPVLASICAAKQDFIIPPIISVDTRHAATAKRALAYGIDWINDVSGLTDPAMREIVASSGKPCVIMHSLSIPASREHIIPHDQDPVTFVYQWGAEKIQQLEQAGISRDNIIVDPGIGFGKTAEQSLQLIKHANIFKQLGVRVLIGHSRKSFLSKLTPAIAKDRDIETAAISIQLANQAIDILRVHNVSLCARSLSSFSYCS